MGIFDIFGNAEKVEAQHSEANDIYEIGVTGVHDNTTKESVNWSDKAPDLVIPSIKNLRACADKSTYVNGIIEDLIMKSISGWVITGDDAEAVKMIQEMDKEWNLNEMFHDTVRNCVVDGITFYDKIITNNRLSFRELAFDGEDYRIKEIYDETGKIVGYKQVVKINKESNSNWIKKKFAELTNSKEEMEFNFPLDKIFAPCLFRRKGKPHSLVKTVIDPAYMVQLLDEMMVQIVYKQANTMVLQLGNKDARNVNVSEEEQIDLIKLASDYHRTGVLLLPFGVTASMIGETVLPKIQEYIACYKEQIFIGLWTPEAAYISSSSNRSTAVVLLDSDKSGRVLIQEFIQEYLAREYQLNVINPQLKLFGKKEDCVWIEFNPVDNRGLYNEEGDASSQQTEQNTEIADGLNLENIRNAEGRLNG